VTNRDQIAWAANMRMVQQNPDDQGHLLG
jgi:hypothetical protein